MSVGLWYVIEVLFIWLWQDTQPNSARIREQIVAINSSQIAQIKNWRCSTRRVSRTPPRDRMSNVVSTDRTTNQTEGRWTRARSNTRCTAIQLSSFLHDLCQQLGSCVGASDEVSCQLGGHGLADDVATRLSFGGDASRLARVAPTNLLASSMRRRASVWALTNAHLRQPSGGGQPPRLP